MVNSNNITFSFGKNWEDFLKNISDEQVRSAIIDIEKWLGHEKIKDKDILDIGCGSGLHSLAYFLLGAKSIDSFDNDLFSVKATKKLWEINNKPINWNIFQGNILDKQSIDQLKLYDIVYSWGVLHHTGNMWHAIENASFLVKPGGLLWISIYAKGSNYLKILDMKQKYNNASNFGKRWMEFEFILGIMFFRIRNFQNPLKWKGKSKRGMDTYHDMIDWLGGLPYEEASEDEVVQFCKKNGFVLNRIQVVPEGGCSTYIFSR
jgi:2-polyprenyl-6-hydroxyphenyl methylase/3-demethylubiquinone-9 3-methyltransferase